jgi:hypothetical protein
VSGADQQQRETDGGRGWWLVGLLAVTGAAAGAVAGHRLAPDVSELAPSLAVAGFGLGGLIGLLLLAPVGLWRAWRRRRIRRRAATPEGAEMPEGPGLWHSGDPEREAAPTAAAEGNAEAAAVETERDGAEEPAPAPGAEEAVALRSPAQPEPEAAPRDTAETPRPEPEEPPPTAGEEPGWYPDPARDGQRRYWDGQAWTDHVWRGRTGARTRKARSRR